MIPRRKNTPGELQGGDRQGERGQESNRYSPSPQNYVVFVPRQIDRRKPINQSRLSKLGSKVLPNPLPLHHIVRAFI